ncbi:MAG: hypothetical protein ACN6PB_07595 [Achromobacter kerstersii]
MNKPETDPRKRWLMSAAGSGGALLASGILMRRCILKGELQSEILMAVGEIGLKRHQRAGLRRWVW